MDGIPILEYAVTFKDVRPGSNCAISNCVDQPSVALLSIITMLFNSNLTFATSPDVDA